MFREPTIGLGPYNTDRGFMFDTTGQFTDLNGNKDLSRVSKRPLIVNDINFVPFGDPDAPPNVRRERLHTMLAGDQGSFERKRDMAGQ